MKLKEKVKADFKKLPKQDKTELIKEYYAQDNTSTDDESHNNDVILNISKDALNGDKWGNCKLSEAIEKGDINEVRNLCSPLTELNDTDMLRILAFDMMNNNLSLALNISVRESVYSEAKHQLELMGEDVSDVIEAYNIH